MIKNVILDMGNTLLRYSPEVSLDKYCTSDEKKSSIAGIVIGLTLTFVHLIGINLTGTSVNPARSLAPATIMAIVGDTKAISQVWVFIVAPFVGSVLAAFAYKFLNKETK